MQDAEVPDQDDAHEILQARPTWTFLHTELMEGPGTGSHRVNVGKDMCVAEPVSHWVSHCTGFRARLPMTALKDAVLQIRRLAPKKVEAPRVSAARQLWSEWTGYSGSHSHQPLPARLLPPHAQEDAVAGGARGFIWETWQRMMHTTQKPPAACAASSILFRSSGLTNALRGEGNVLQLPRQDREGTGGKRGRGLSR